MPCHRREQSRFASRTIAIDSGHVFLPLLYHTSNPIKYLSVCCLPLPFPLFPSNVGVATKVISSHKMVKNSCLSTSNFSYQFMVFVCFWKDCHDGFFICLSTVFFAFSLENYISAASGCFLACVLIVQTRTVSKQVFCPLNTWVCNFSTNPLFSMTQP